MIHGKETVMEKYEKPNMEIVDLENDVITARVCSWQSGNEGNEGASIDCDDF